MKKILSILCGLFILVSSVFSVNVYAKKPIPIAMCLDDNYTLPTIVAMTSMLENVKEDTEYKYYLLVPGDFTEENKQKILSLKEKYKSKSFDINFIDMKNDFKGAKTVGRWTLPMYYRLNLPGLLNEYNKCIYLDGDTVVNKDLSEFFNIDLEDNYVGGVRAAGPGARFLKSIGLKPNNNYINSGVLLMNLKKLRDDRIEDKFEWYAKNQKEKLICPDQDILNVCCYGKVKVLPPKYSLMEHALNSKYYLSSYGKVQNDEAFRDPMVIHYAASKFKPWKSLWSSFAEKWWEYAIKSGFYDKIPESLKMEK